MQPFVLSGLDGANPLGFLAAVGALVTLHEGGTTDARLRWQSRHRWTPILEGVPIHHEGELVGKVAQGLRGRPVAADAEARRAGAQRDMEAAKRARDRKAQEIRRRKLKGTERAAAIDRELRPLEATYQRERRRWLDELRQAVPRPELALGKRIDCTREEYREHAATLASVCQATDRSPLDLLAAFGSDGCLAKRSEPREIEPTPFCFVSGSGQQYFLDAVRQLIERIDPERVKATLFETWSYQDEKLSLRWDPAEDRRYALLDRDPSDDSARTVWMANLLAYRGLALFPGAPAPRGLAVAGWMLDSEVRTFTWPLWRYAVGLDAVRSLVQMRELVKERPDPIVLRAYGVAAVYRARRIEVGAGINKKRNFSTASRVV